MLRSRIFLGGQGISLLGDGLATLAIPLMVLQLTRNPVVAALASAPRSMGYLGAGVLAGLLTDRLDPWRVMVAADVTRVAVFSALFALTGLHAASVGLILALAFAAGAATVFFETALAITVQDLYTGPQLVPANGWLESANQGGQVIGPAVAATFAAAGILPVALLLDALTFVVSLATLAALRGSYHVPRGPERRPTGSWSALRRDLAEGVRFLTATRLLLTLLTFLLVLNLCLGTDRLVVFFAKETLRLPGSMVGIIVAAGGIGGILGAVCAAPLCRRLSPLSLVAVCSASSGIALIIMSTATSMSVFLIGNMLYTWAVIAASVTLRALRQVLVPRELLGRVTAAIRISGQIVTPVGAVLAGAITGLLDGNPRPVFAAAGILTALTVLVAWFVGMRHEDTTWLAASMRSRQTTADSSDESGAATLEDASAAGKLSHIPGNVSINEDHHPE